jgi:hypothetical protein
MIAFRSIRYAALVGAIAVATVVLSASPSLAQRSYSSAEEAAAALVTAVRSGPRSAILKVLGNAAEDIVSSGDEVEDAEARQRFLAAYDAGHSIKAAGNKTATLILGAEDFPFPIPLVKTKTGWEFDTDAGRIEILQRRVGRNELDAIQASLAFVDAQNQYAEKDRGDGAGVYAQRIVSSPGKKDGLFWRDDGDPSPLGALAAQASAEGYKLGEGSAPYHGYYFRILKGQGTDAPGGALNYVVKGKMIGGFALIAYPADYGNSGIMTFLVNHAGTVYQKDLGKRTEALAARISLFNPDPTWKKVDLAKPGG